MRILYVIHQFYPETSSGTERFLLNLASAVQKDGHRVDIVTYSLGLESTDSNEAFAIRKYLYCRLPVTAVRHRRVPLDVHASMENQELFWFAVSLLDSVRPDIVHVAHPMRMGAFVAAASRQRVPYLITLTDFWLICPKINLRTSFNSLCSGPNGGKTCKEFCPELHNVELRKRLATASKLLAGASFVTVPSRFVAEILASEFPEIKIRVVPHGLDLRNLRRAEKISDRDGKIVFAYCGGLARHKGVHDLIKAFRNLKGNVELQLHGEFSEKEPYHKSLQQLALGDERVRFCDPYPASQVGEVLRSVDVLIIPSLSYETYGFAMHEAFAAKVPVVAADIPVLGEEVKQLNAGLTFVPGDEKDLSDRLQHIVNEPRVLSTIRNNLADYVPPLVEEEAFLYEGLYSEMAQC